MFDGYSFVTEAPGKSATAEELAMLYTRYDLAASMAQGKDVLEVACGPGMGLGLLASRARRFVGGDYDPRLLRVGRAHYGKRVPLVCLDAQALPFGRATFDLVILFEAIYYLPKVDGFVEEVRRILRGRGALLICSANKERPGFHPSSLSLTYYSASELQELLSRHGFRVEMAGAFPVAPALRRRSRGAARRLANLLRLSPRAKAVVKRILFRETLVFPAEIAERAAGAGPLIPISGEACVRQYQVLYAIGRLS